MRALCLFALIAVSSGCADVPLGPALAEAIAFDLTDPRTATDFAAAWQTSVEGPDPEAARAALRADWIARQYRWRGYALAGLCQARTCSVRVLPTAAARLSRMGAGMAIVRFRPAEMARLEAACGGATGCEIDFEGVLTEAQTAPDQPLRLVFEGATLRATRTPDAAWFARPPRPERARRTGLRTGRPVKAAFRLPGARF